MPVLKEEEIIQIEEKVDEIVLKVFLKALDIVGGPRKLILYRHLTWVPSLIEACYAVVLKEKFLKTESEIAQILGLTKQTVRNILSAKTEGIIENLESELKKKVIKTHVAGALAKLAFKEINQGN
ncbi:probable regulatory domain-containing protein [Candidatus Kryptobacter tengchongensis]|uniref:Probable regulatory domain-containing protein n=2 Tax=Kryptobacter tengchongensis TaxID=1643429 RepID=A0A656D5F5_KRYT1|nr:regulatory domain protein [Candidatus Kryptobacter tengchongensis]CUS99802.1 probable regulatory domain-containing protein [Candidatus Kryptobacter tengchongensis]CUT01242.1 probable regulatory domain-containing protein [Candidatus Kryptobacter tengchongensis]CUU07334.1 probable regulatory domain-containing protein [Candidatus Kryptobacter tengchongensis]CUU10735.1 probable regulatory domain-containing protein [Candidatus Kryptobacter tengchongensis]